MTSAETKVIVLALLIVGVGFVYTNIQEKYSLTGKATTYFGDTDVFAPQGKSDVAYNYEQEAYTQNIPSSEVGDIASLAASVCTDSRVTGGILGNLGHECELAFSPEKLNALSPEEKAFLDAMAKQYSAA